MEEYEGFEIDREALAKALCKDSYPAFDFNDECITDDVRDYFRKKAELTISTMPTWLKRIEK